MTATISKLTSGGERLITITKAAQQCAALGIPLNRENLWRYCAHGFRGRKIDSATVCGKLYVTIEGVQRFLEACEAEASDTNEMASLTN